MMVKLPKCKCGASVGLSLHGERWWCPDCLWAEVERLRAENDRRRESADWKIINGQVTYTLACRGVVETIGRDFRPCAEKATRQYCETCDPKSEVERLRRRDKQLHAGIVALDIRLLCDCKLENDLKGRWWLCRPDGQKLFGGTGSLLDIIEQLAADEAAKAAGGGHSNDPPA